MFFLRLVLVSHRLFYFFNVIFLYSFRFDMINYSFECIVKDFRIFLSTFTFGLSLLLLFICLFLLHLCFLLSNLSTSVYHPYLIIFITKTFILLILDFSDVYFFKVNLLFLLLSHFRS